MNAEFIGDWDVAPRGHPNDGRAEVLQVDASLPTSPAIGRATTIATGTHLPTRGSGTGSVRDATFEFADPMVLCVDGVDVGTARSMSVHVRPDAVVAYA